VAIEAQGPPRIVNAMSLGMDGVDGVFARGGDPHRPEDAPPDATNQNLTGDEGPVATASRGPHWQGAPCWQPHLHVEATAAGVWQPQVQAAPIHWVQWQALLAFMAFSIRGGQARLACTHPPRTRQRTLERKG